MGELSNTTINGVSYDFKDAGAARQSHSHTKSQITDFPTSMPASDVSTWAKASTKPTYTASEVGAIATTAKGAASGVAELDANGKVPSSQLPSFVDDVLEYSAKSSFPATGETGKIYVDTSNNKTYRWSGSAYVEISPSLALGETSSTAYRGDRGKAAYDHSQTTSGNPHNTTASEVGAVPNTAAGVSAAINQLTTGDSAPTDNDYYVSQYAGGGTSTTTYHRRPVSKLWEYIKSKLASKGSATQPVYFSNGVPVATTYTLGKSVPADAKFTDTTYSAATTSAAGLMSAADKTKLNGIATGANNYTHPTSAGNKHIPSGGSTGQILVYGGSSGTAVWGSVPCSTIAASNVFTAIGSTTRIDDDLSNLYIQGKHLFGTLMVEFDSASTQVATIKSAYLPVDISTSYQTGTAFTERYQNQWMAAMWSLTGSSSAIILKGNTVSAGLKAMLRIDYLIA